MLLMHAVGSRLISLSGSSVVAITGMVSMWRTSKALALPLYLYVVCSKGTDMFTQRRFHIKNVYRKQNLIMYVVDLVLS